MSKGEVLSACICWTGAVACDLDNLAGFSVVHGHSKQGSMDEPWMLLAFLLHIHGAKALSVLSALFEQAVYRKGQMLQQSKRTML